MSEPLLFHRILSSTITRVRGKEYKLDSEMSSLSVTAIILQKLIAAARGFLHGLAFRHCVYPLFVGRKTIIRNPRYISLGKGVVIDDFTTIEALSRKGVFIGDGTTLEKHVLVRVTGVLSNLGEGLRIGSGCSVGAFSYVGAAGGISIGNNVLIGQRVSLHAENHRFDDTSRLIKEQGVSRKGIVIGNDCWIGSGAIILDGVTIGEGSVIGAGSVVSGDISPYSIAIGVPARVIRIRGQQA